MLDNFYQKIQEAYKLEYETEVDETKPYDNRYEARKILKDLLQQIHSLEENRQIMSVYIQTLLGINYFDTEENQQASDTLNKAMEQSKLLDIKFIQQYNLKMTLYNSIGFLQVSRDQDEEGLNNLQQSQQVYKQYQTDKDIQLQDDLINNILNVYCDIQVIDQLLLKTEFYLAQAYAKIGDKHKAAYYCGITLQKQVKERQKGNIPQEWDINDFGNNCIGLSQYYIEEKQFKEALIVLEVGIEIAQKESEDKEIVGHLQFQLGNLYLSVFDYNLSLIVGKVSNIELEEKNQVANFCKFEELTLEKLENIKLFDNYPDSKIYFKKSLQNLKKAQEILKIDGYVSEYIEISKAMANLYKSTLKLEQDIDRIKAIESRIEQILDIRSQINPKYFITQYIELTAELGEIKSRQFDRQQKIFSEKGKGLKKLQRIGDEVIKLYNEVIEYFKKEKNEHQQSYINCLYMIGRVYTHCYQKDQKVMRENLIKALNTYKEVKRVILEIKEKQQILPDLMNQQLLVTSEFIELLPLRINKL